MSQRRLRSLRGRLEYQGWLLTSHPEEPDQGHCPLRLVLYDLPPGAVVVIQTRWERHRRAGADSRRVYAFRIPSGRSTLTHEMDLEAYGSLRVEVYRPTKQQPRPPVSHLIEYRIDPRQQRPVRNNYLTKKLQLQLEETFRRPESQVPSRDHASVLPLPAGSLFALALDQGQEGPEARSL